MQEKENDDKNIMSADKNEGGDAKVYEVGYLLVPEISEEELPAVYGNLKELVSSFDGNIISDEIPTMINLAYTMQKTVQNVRSKYNAAYFGWIKFHMEAGKVLNLKKKLDQDGKVIRFLIIKTIKENTVASKRFTQKDSTRKKAPVIKNIEAIPESVIINKEEIDKEIDAMIAEA